MQANLDLHFWLTQWNRTPSIYIGVVLLTALYLYAIGPLRKKHQFADAVKRSLTILFVAGMLVLLLALASPLDELGDEYLFSAHMVQHLIITLVVPPLLLLGTPGWLLEPLLSKRVLLTIGKALTHPFVAFFLFNVDFWLWHAPVLYDATLANENLHIFEHLLFIVTATIYWWPILSPVKELPRLSLGGQVLYLFLSGMPSVALGAGLTFMQPLYAPYIQQPIRAWGLSPVSDQQLGGLIMWVPVNIIFIIVVSIIFIRWMQAQDERQRLQEAQVDAENALEALEDNIEIG